MYGNITIDSLKKVVRRYVAQIRITFVGSKVSSSIPDVGICFSSAKIHLANDMQELTIQ